MVLPFALLFLCIPSIKEWKRSLQSTFVPQHIDSINVWRFIIYHLCTHGSVIPYKYTIFIPVSALPTAPRNQSFWKRILSPGRSTVCPTSNCKQVLVYPSLNLNIVRFYIAGSFFLLISSRAVTEIQWLSKWTKVYLGQLYSYHFLSKAPCSIFHRIQSPYDSLVFVRQTLCLSTSIPFDTPSFSFDQFFIFTSTKYSLQFFQKNLGQNWCSPSSNWKFSCFEVCQWCLCNSVQLWKNLLYVMQHQRFSRQGQVPIFTITISNRNPFSHILRKSLRLPQILMNGATILSLFCFSSTNTESQKFRSFSNAVFFAP